VVFQNPLFCYCLLKAPVAFFMIISEIEIKWQLTRTVFTGVTCFGDLDTASASLCDEQHVHSQLGSALECQYI